MRPRVFPAEDLEPLGLLDVPDKASMRPRVFPAEDPTMPMDAESRRCPLQ